MSDPAGELPAAPALFEPPLSAMAAPASGPAADLSPRAFRFTGSGPEYFRIWIVNLLLSVVTLGIYSAWAKVRRLRYFHGHTVVDGAAFGYHASPIAILKGRLIAYAVIGTLAVLGNVAPLLASALYLPLLVLMPIALVRAFRFRAANSSWRGIRFGFDGSEVDAYRVYLLLPLVVPLSLGLIYPLIVAKQREFLVGNSRFGQARFTLALPLWPVYRIYAVAAALGFGWLVLGLAVLGAGLAAGPVLDGGNGGAGAGEAVSGLATGLFAALLLSAYLMMGVLYVGVRTAFENLVWNHTALGPHRFESRLRIGDMLALYASNLVLIAITLGLAVPWARVRLASYRAARLTLLPGGPLVSEADAAAGVPSATGAELTDAMDLDFGL
jgi:uncharacterized membrane protein YjgN (DUF898 family)